ncbi:MAG: deoxyribose-phosphate aldolase, partial [Planctomycetes bacterium]|nr:deoxyribose-phosphate aldolase [Planctomycetota bacterium]
MVQTKEELAKYFDHTQLNSVATESDIRVLCDQAVRYEFYSACVQARWVGLCADILHGTGVKVVSVAGFPFGTDSPAIKAMQAKEVIMAGADEVDMVADLAAIISGDEKVLRTDIQSVLDVCRSLSPAVVLKVIIEAQALTTDQIRFACAVAQSVGADFVKSSTGFHSSGGARLEDVRLMVESAPGCKVKASAAIRTLEQTLSFIEAGAVRIGSSSSVQIMEEFIAAHG